MKSKTTIFIVNPAAAKGALKKAWSSLAHGLKGKVHNFDVAFTRHAGDGVTLTSQAIDDGYDMVVAVGGDGSLSECVNGFFHKKRKMPPKTMLGILPFGRGSDFARGLGFSRLPEQAMERLKGQNHRLVDVGKVTCLGSKQKQKTFYFLNNAYFGLGSNVDYWSKRCPRILGPTIGYFYGLIRGNFEYEPQVVSLEFDQQKIEVDFTNVTIANGPYFGSGMLTAPDADVGDGLLDITVYRPQPFVKGMLSVRKLYSGDFPGMECYQTKKVIVTPQQKKERIKINLDGDSHAYLPAEFEIMPQALRFKV